MKENEPLKKKGKKNQIRPHQNHIPFLPFIARPHCTPATPKERLPTFFLRHTRLLLNSDIIILIPIRILILIVDIAGSHDLELSITNGAAVLPRVAELLEKGRFVGVSVCGFREEGVTVAVGEIGIFGIGSFFLDLDVGINGDLLSAGEDFGFLGRSIGSTSASAGASGSLALSRRLLAAASFLVGVVSVLTTVVVGGCFSFPAFSRRSRRRRGTGARWRRAAIGVDAVGFHHAFVAFGAVFIVLVLALCVSLLMSLFVSVFAVFHGRSGRIGREG